MLGSLKFGTDIAKIIGVNASPENAIVATKFT
jgi:hypothetical protein